MWICHTDNVTLKEYFVALEEYCNRLENERGKTSDIINEIRKEKYEAEEKLEAQYRANDILIEELNKGESTQRKLNKALWALHEQMGDKGIYIELGYEELYFPTFEELRKWIEE